MSEYLAQKHALYAQVGRLSRALGQQTRLEIIEILAQAPRSVETIASLLQTDIRSVSQHLQVLVECGLLTVERKGRFRWYAVRCQEVLQLAVLLRTTAETLLGAPQTDVKDELSLSEGLSLAQQGKLQLIDVRPLEEFQSGHLAGALSMRPLQNWTRKLPLPPTAAVPTAFWRGRLRKSLPNTVRRFMCSPTAYRTGRLRRPSC